MMTEASTLLLLALVAIAAGITGAIVVQRRIVASLADVSIGLQRIANGQLDRSVTVQGPGKIVRMGEMVNDIAANQQEVLLHLWRQTDHSIDLIDRISETVRIGVDNGNRDRVRADLKAVRNSMKDLQGLTAGVAFYNVHLEGRSAVTPEARPETDEGRRNDMPA